MTADNTLLKYDSNLRAILQSWLNLPWIHFSDLSDMVPLDKCYCRVDHQWSSEQPVIVSALDSLSEYQNH